MCLYIDCHLIVQTFIIRLPADCDLEFHYFIFSTYVRLVKKWIA